MVKKQGDIESSVRAFVSASFDCPDQSLTKETLLFERFGRADPDEFSHFLTSFSRRFEVKTPRIVDARKYLDHAVRRHGLRLGDIVRVLTRRAAIIATEISLEELCAIARSGVWPSRYIEVANGVAT